MSVSFDMSTTQMLITLKLISFSFNLYDGIVDYKKIFNEENNKNNNEMKELTYKQKQKINIYNDRKLYAITKLPSYIEFLGYIYNFNSLLAGPIFEFITYKNVIYNITISNTSNNTSDNNNNTSSSKMNNNNKIPSSLYPSLYRFILAIILMGSYLQLTVIFPISNLYSIEFILNHSLLYRFAYFMIRTLVDRLKYYFVWKLGNYI
jgi:lysophospholipid acyltransferase